MQSVRFRAWAGTVCRRHVLRLAPRVQRFSMPRSPLSKIKDQGGCECSLRFHQKLCESRRRAARGFTSCSFPIFVSAYFLHFRFSSWWLSTHNNFSTSAASCALGDFVGDRNRVTGECRIHSKIPISSNGSAAVTERKDHRVPPSQMIRFSNSSCGSFSAKASPIVATKASCFFVFQILPIT